MPSNSANVKNIYEFKSELGVNTALEFLNALDGEGAFTLTAIDKTGRTASHTFQGGPKRDAKIESWLRQHYHTSDIYYHVGEPTATAPHNKLGKADVGMLRALHLDIDPQEGQDLDAERARLRALLLDLTEDFSDDATPTAIVDSGGGFQALWKLPEKLAATPENIARIEALNVSLIQKFGGDQGTHNVDRLMRLPGTINHARAKKKLAQGRPVRQSEIVYLDAAQTTPVENAVRIYGLAKVESSAGGNPNGGSGYPGQDCLTRDILAAFKTDRADDYEDLGAELREKFDALCARKPKLARLVAEGRDAIADIKRGDVSAHFGNTQTGEETPPEEGDRENDTSGNGWRVRVAGYIFKSSQFDAIEYARIMWTLEPGRLQEIVADQGEWHAARQAARDWLFIEAREKERATQTEAPKPDTDGPKADAPAPDATPAPEAPAPDAPAEPEKTKKSKLSFVMFDDEADAALEEPESQLVEDLFDEGAMIVLYGDSNAGKSFIALQISHAIATGTPFAGKKTKQGLVVYVVAEGGRRFRRRLSALRRQFPEHKNLPIALVKSAVDLYGDSDHNELVRLIREAEEQTGLSCGLVVLDTLSRVMGAGDENSGRDMNMIVKQVDAIREQTRAAVLLVHHSGKDRAKGARGHSSLRAATDTEIEVTKDRGSLAGQMEVTKQRDMDSGAKFGFRLIDMDLGADQNGTPRKAAFAEMLDADATARRAAVPKGPRLTPTEQEVMRAIEKLASERGAAEDAEAWEVEVTQIDIRAEIDADRAARTGPDEKAAEMKKSQLSTLCTSLREKKALFEGAARGTVRLPTPDKGAAFEAVEDDE